MGITKLEDLKKETEGSQFSIIHYEELGMCGCGNPDDVKKMVKELLIAQSIEDWQTRYDRRNEILLKSVENGAVLEFILNSLDNNSELMAHGGYIGNGWVTEKGNHFIYLLEKEETGMLDITID